MGYVAAMPSLLTPRRVGHFRLPPQPIRRRRGDGHTMHSTDTTGDDSPTDRSADRTTVLVADDDRAFRETLLLWLADDRQWRSREAADGEEALSKLDGAVDVLVLDRRMPNLSGPEVVERLDETGFDGPVVVLSAFEPDDHLTDGEVAAYLTKPIDRETFVGALADVAGRPETPDGSA